MKKLVVLVSTLVLVFALVATTSAANLNLTGSLKGWVTVTKPISSPFATTGGMELEIKSALSIGSGATVTLGNTFGKTTNNFDGSLGWGNFNNVAVNNVWLVIEGAYWTGGPSVKTTIGNFEYDYGAGKAWREGFKIEGINVGKFSGNFYSVATGSNDWQSVLSFGLGDSSLKLDGAVKKGSAFDNGLEVSGTVTMVPTDELTLKAFYATKNADWWTSADLKASENVKLFGKFSKGNNYEVKATIDMDAMFDPTLQVGYSNTGSYWLRVDGSYDTLKAAVRYAASNQGLALVAGNGTIYDLAASDITNVNKVDPWSGDGGVAGRTGWVGVYTNSNAADAYARVATRFDLKTLIDLGISDATSLTARADMKTNLTTGVADKAKFGVLLGTKFTVGGFENVSFNFDVTTDTVASTTSWGMSAGYTAPNGIGFSATYGDAGTLTVTGSKSISF